MIVKNVSDFEPSSLHQNLCIGVFLMMFPAIPIALSLHGIFGVAGYYVACASFIVGGRFLWRFLFESEGARNSYITWIKKQDVDGLIAASQSQEFDSYSKKAILDYLNANHTGWSLSK